MRKKNPAEQCAQGVSNWNVLKLDDVTMMQPFSKVHAAVGYQVLKFLFQSLHSDQN